MTLQLILIQWIHTLHTMNLLDIHMHTSSIFLQYFTSYGPLSQVNLPIEEYVDDQMRARHTNFGRVFDLSCDTLQVQDSLEVIADCKTAWKY